MSSELTLFQEFDGEENSIVTYMLRLQCYQGLPQDSIEKLEKYVSDAKRIANKASFDLAEKLCEAREEFRDNKHGGFEGWIEERLGISKQTAYRIIWRYEQFGSVENLEQLDIALTAQYALSQPSTPQTARDEAIQLAESGTKITVKLSENIIEKHKKDIEEAEKIRKEIQKEFDLFKQQVKREISLKNQELDLLKRDRQMREDEYAKLEAEKEQIAQSKVQVLKEDTPETKAKLAKIEQELKNLEAQQKKLQAERDEKDKQLQFTNKYVDDLTKQIQGYNRDNQLIAHHKEIRFKWQQACDAFHLGIKQGMARMVTQHDAQQAFEGDDWARLADLEAALQRTLESLSALRKHTTIDASMDYVVEA